MSQGLGSSGGSRDYGTNGPPVPAVGFADFSPTELYNLCENISANISSINAGSKFLDKTFKQIGTNKDNSKLREQTHETQQNANSYVTTTTKDLKRLREVVRRGDKQQKLQVERLSQTLTDAVAKYTEIQKLLSEKMQKHMPITQMANFSRGRSMDENDDQARLVEQMQAEIRVSEFESSLLEEREAYVRRIEADVLDVNQIMRELGNKIHEQGGTIDTIESHLEAGASHVEMGREELIKASRYQAKFRRKMLILLVIALSVGIILTIIIVRSLKR